MEKNAEKAHSRRSAFTERINRSEKPKHYYVVYVTAQKIGRRAELVYSVLA